MSKRREFSANVKLAAFKRANGLCEGKDCGARLSPGRFHYDHDIPDFMGGEPTLENCKVLCIVCHAVKTGQKDIPTYAKGVRLQKRAAGIRKPSRFPCSRNSRFKKKVDGSVVLREPRT